MPIVNANTVPATRPVAAQNEQREPVPAWARPQLAWPFRASQPLTARTSSRPSVPSFST